MGYDDYFEALEYVKHLDKVKSIASLILSGGLGDEICLNPDEPTDIYPWDYIAYSMLENPEFVKFDFDKCPNCGKERIQLYFQQHENKQTCGYIEICISCKQYFGLNKNLIINYFSQNCTAKTRCMLEEYKYIPKQGKLTALCRTAHDSWYNLDLPQLTIGESYTVEYAVIGSSICRIGLSAFPNETFNSAQFNFYMNDDAVSLIWDYSALKKLMNDKRGKTIVIYDELSTERISEIKQRHNGMRIVIRSEIIKGCPNYKDKYVELWESLKSQIEAEQSKLGFYHPLYKEALTELLRIYKDMENTRKTSEVENLLSMVAEQEI